MLTLMLALSLSLFRSPSLDRTIHQVEQSVVRVVQGSEDEASTRICTGFVVESGPSGRVVTAAHCVGDWHRLEVDAVAAAVIAVDPQLDLAVLRVSTTKLAVAWTRALPKRFETVVGIGYGDGLSQALALPRTVVVPMLAPHDGMPPGLLVGLGWIHGMSGGPVVNRKGEVIGIIQRTNDSNTLGYGVPTETIFKFLLTEPAVEAPTPSELP